MQRRAQHLIRNLFPLPPRPRAALNPFLTFSPVIASIKRIPSSTGIAKGYY